MARNSKGNFKDISFLLVGEISWKSGSGKKSKQIFKLIGWVLFLQIYCNLNLKDQNECQQAVGDHYRKDHKLSL